MKWLILSGKHFQAINATITPVSFEEVRCLYFVKAHSTVEGFIYASYKRGGRLIDVCLSGHQHAVRKRFAVLLSTESFGYEKSALRERYGQVEKLPDMTLEQVREQLRRLSCCTSNAEETDQRNHMRLWLAPFRCEGEPVWIGQVSRDIGVKLTARSPTLATHIFDRKIDVLLCDSAKRYGSRFRMTTS